MIGNHPIEGEHPNQSQTRTLVCRRFGEALEDPEPDAPSPRRAKDLIEEALFARRRDITFSDRMTLELGGKQVELIHVGRNHSDNSIVMLLPEERTLFAVDFMSTRRLPFRTLSDSYYPDWVDSLRRVEQLDFDRDLLTPGRRYS